MNQKYIVKFEQGTLEQSYKLSEIDLSGGGVNDIFEILDAEFIGAVVTQFTEMRKIFNTAYKRYN